MASAILRGTGDESLLTGDKGQGDIDPHGQCVAAVINARAHAVRRQTLTTDQGQLLISDKFPSRTAVSKSGFPTQKWVAKEY